MHLLVDNGGSTATWILARQGNVLHRHRTEGIHPLLVEEAQMLAICRQVGQNFALEAGQLDALFFYSTGTRNADVRERLRKLLDEAFPGASAIEVHTDLAAAARAGCRHTPGIACILGTGSNAGRYDGRRIIASAGGLGYILGDEGGGAGLGRRLLGAYLDGRLPHPIRRQLEEEMHTNPEGIYEGVYRRPHPNRFLASFAPFLHRHRAQPAVRQLLEEEFTAFLQRYVLPLTGDNALPVHFVGSVAHHFEAEIRAAGGALNLDIAGIQPDPMDGLVTYHA